MSNSGSTAIVTNETILEANSKKQAEETAKKEEFVKRQAYEEVSNDMHKFKSRAKDAEARAAEIEAKLKAIEEQKLRDEQKYQELYEREKKEREKTEATRKRERELYLRAVKLSALKAELGNVKDVYLSHANIEGIEVREDGTLNSDSVRDVANQFRQEHPTLIPTSSGSNITNLSSPTSFNATKPKSLGEMTFEEKAAYYKQLKNK